MDNFTLIEKTLGQVLDATVAKFPKNEAVVYPDANFRQTWEEFNQSVNTLAKGLMALGVQKGEKVAIWATNVPEWISLMFATAKIGAVLITVNTSYRDRELLYLLQQSHCENLFIINGYKDHSFLQSTYNILPELFTQKQGELKSADLPHLKRVVYIGEEAQEGMLFINDVYDLAKNISEEEFQARQDSLDPDDVINMQYTSGTTGFPKGVMLNHLSISNNGYWIGKNQKLSEKDRLCIPVPLFHCFGCVLGVLACLHHGTTMVVLESFSPVHVMQAIDNEKCTSVYGVPTMFLAIVGHKLFKTFDYSSLRTGIMSGTVCPEPLMKRVLEEMNMHEITIPYGLTENSPVMSMTTTDENIEDRCLTVGREMPGIEVAIKDPSTGENLPPNTPGEVCCRGYSVMKGYYNNEEATREVIDADGWLHTGDIGVLDERGYLRITGRIKDMILRGGENIYPREIEEFLLAMPEIKDVQVVAVPSETYGEEVGAFLLPHDNKTITPKDVRDFCRGKIAWHKVPRHIASLESFPLTASGKIQKYKLRELATEMFCKK